MLGLESPIARCPNPPFFTINTPILAQSMPATPYLRRQVGGSRPVSGRGVVYLYEQGRPRFNEHAHLCCDTTSSRTSRGFFSNDLKIDNSTHYDGAQRGTQESVHKGRCQRRMNRPFLKQTTNRDIYLSCPSNSRNPPPHIIHRALSNISHYNTIYTMIPKVQNKKAPIITPSPPFLVPTFNLHTSRTSTPPHPKQPRTPSDAPESPSSADSHTSRRNSPASPQ